MPDSISAAKLRRAQEEFAHHLSNETTEPIWQRFFAANRFVLSRSLPLKLLPCDVLPLGRPGKSEPDFILCPGSPESESLHGIVEIKTNTSRIVRRARRNVLTLSSDATTALRQALKYDQTYDDYAPIRRAVTLESANYLFVIMGQAKDIDPVVGELWEDFHELMRLPVRFVAYDDLFRSFSKSVPKPLLLLNVSPPASALAWASSVTSGTRKLSVRLHRLQTPMGVDPSEFAWGGGEPQALIRAAFERSMDREGPFKPRGVAGISATTGLDDALAGVRFHMSLFHAAARDRTPADRDMLHLSFQFDAEVVDVPLGPESERVFRRASLTP